MAHAASQLKKKADENLAAEEEKEKKKARKRSREVKKKVETRGRGFVRMQPQTVIQAQHTGGGGGVPVGILGVFGNDRKMDKQRALGEREIKNQLQRTGSARVRRISQPSYETMLKTKQVAFNKHIKQLRFKFNWKSSFTSLV